MNLTQDETKRTLRVVKELMRSALTCYEYLKTNWEICGNYASRSRVPLMFFWNCLVTKVMREEESEF